MEYKIGDSILTYMVRDVKKGGFGIVYIIYNQESKREWAVKSFQDKFFKVGDKKANQAVKDFYREAEVWVKLGRHENIVEALFVFDMEYKPHIFVEYVNGGSLRESLVRGSLSVPKVLFLAIQFCDGMIYANSVNLGEGRRGIVHRDIKPENIMLTKESVLKITDFGLVKALGTSTAETPMGTPEYMSPEQFHTMDVDTRSDIYSFGVVLYEMLTGRPPFWTGDEKKRWVFYEEHHRETNPLWPRYIDSSIPEKLETIVLKCLKKKPKNRYQCFEDLREELMEVYRSQFGQIPEVKKRKLTDFESYAKERLKGDSLIQLRRYQEAVPFFEGVLDKLDEVLADLDKVLGKKLTPSHALALMHAAYAWTNKGLALQGMNRFEEAIECYDKALEINPRDAQAWVGRAMTLNDMGRHGEAISFFDRALEINPRHAQAWVGKGWTLHYMSRHGEAIPFFDRALEIDPRGIWALCGKGMALEGLGRFEEAIECYDKALEINPRYARAWNGKGWNLYNLGRFEEAIECYDKALEINPRGVGAWVGRGVTLSRLGRYTEAIPFFDRALEINPRHAQALFRKGTALAMLDRYREAIPFLDETLKINPRHDFAWYFKGMALNNLGRFEEAIECYNKALEINSGYNLAWRGKGSALNNLGKYMEDIECYDKALEINPRDAKALFAKGYALSILGKHREALECYRKAVEIEPSLRKKLERFLSEG